jgi:virulence-associated protein VapD
MIDDFIHFKVGELKSMKDSLENRLAEIKNYFEQIDNAVNTISKILEKHGVENNDTSIILPRKLFNQFAISNVKTKFNWKKIAFENLKIHDDFLTTEEIYERTKLVHPIELVNRRKSIQNFSAALNYLKSEGKIMQIKKNNKFLYGLTLKHYEHSLSGNKKVGISADL